MKRSGGSGSISAVSAGRWRLRVSLADGTRRSVTTDAENEEHAQRLLDALIYELASTHHLSTGSPTMRALGERWLDEREISKNAQAHERTTWKNHVLDASMEWADLPVSTITRADCVRWLELLEHKKAKKPAGWKKGGRELFFDRTLSVQTRTHCRNVLKKFFDWCVAKKLVRESPATGLPVRSTKVDHEREDAWTFLTRDELDKLRTCAAIPEQTRDLFLFAIYTAMRQGELWALRWRDIELDGEKPRCTVRRSHDRTTKTKHVRRFPLFAPAVEIVERQRQRVPHGPDDLVWPDHNGDRREEKSDAGWSDKAGAKGVRVAGWKTIAGITRHVRFHDLRHTCASHLVMGTWGRAWSLLETQKFIGHRSQDMTQRYAHLSADHLHSAAANTLAPPVGPERANDWPARANVGPRAVGPEPTVTTRTASESPEKVLERATGFEPATASLGIQQALECFRTLLAQASNARPTELVAREFLGAVANEGETAGELLDELVIAAFREGFSSDSRLGLALTVTEGGPFRWRRGIELAAQLLTATEGTKSKERAR